MLATITKNLGTVSLMENHPELAIPLFTKARSIIEALGSEAVIPGHLGYSRDREAIDIGLSSCHTAIASQQYETGDFARATPHFEQAHKLLTSLIYHTWEPWRAKEPVHPDARAALHVNSNLWAQMLRQQATTAHESHEAARAVALYEHALQLWRDCKESGPHDDATARWLADTEWLDLTHELLAWACDERIDQLNLTNAAERTETERLVNVGINALQSLPEPLQARHDLAKLRNELTLRRSALKFPGAAPRTEGVSNK
jgi:hypothetical protein